MKKKQIKRAAFERAPWRVIPLQVVEITFPDGRTSRVDLRLQALPGEAGAVEMAAECARELFTQERAGVKLMQRDFLTIAPDEIGLFDAVIMNPPFTMRSDIRHVLRALQFLRPNGTLTALVMDTSHREKALRHLSATWEKIPAGAFKTEGTNVPTVMLSITV